MELTAVIKERMSVRSYTGKPLDEESRDRIDKYIRGLTQPFGGDARIELVSAAAGAEPVKLGTYGVISGARNYLVLVYKDGPLAAQNAGYMFEQGVLYCTSLGLGTCWLGGTLRKSDFASQVRLAENEILEIVSPVGYASEKPKFRDRIMRAGAGSARRKPFGELFFDGGFNKPLTPQGAGKYAEALEMVRLAPSASNTQPWRIVLDDGRLHFYYIQKSRFSALDSGIAMCHFGEVCKESGIRGAFRVLETGVPPSSEKMQYLISWLGEE